MFYIRDYSYKFISSYFAAENKNLTALLSEVEEAIGSLRIDGIMKIIFDDKAG